MRVGVFSDSHGKYDLLQEAMKALGPVDLIIHAGDYYRDARRLAEDFGIPVIGVVGNCDGLSGGPKEEILVLEGHKVLVTHGHHERVKYGLESLIKKAKKINAELVIYGHSHVPDLTAHENIILFNPGSVAAPRTTKNGTYGVLEITKKDIIPHHREMPAVYV